MLEKLPAVFGKTLHRVRPGIDRTVAYRDGVTRSSASLAVESPAFASGDSIPKRYTADGEGMSPPLRWAPAPDGVQSFLVMVEDADSPTPLPLVHAIVAHIPPTATGLAEGAIAVRESETPGGLIFGKTSFLKPGWLPPDPPPGHGAHRYVFQVFALDNDPTFGEHPGRRAVIDALRGHVVAHGVMIGTYRR